MCLENNVDSGERCQVCAMKRRLLTVVPVPVPMVIYCTSCSSCYWLCLKTKWRCFDWTCIREILFQTGLASAFISFTCISLTLAFGQWHLTAMLDLLYWYLCPKFHQKVEGQCLHVLKTVLFPLCNCAFNCVNSIHICHSCSAATFNGYSLVAC